MYITHFRDLTKVELKRPLIHLGIDDMTTESIQTELPN